MSNNGMASGYGVDGTTVNAGSKSNPWAINDFADLKFLKDNSSYWGNSVYYQQTSDIIVTESSTTYNTNILGIYNGSGYKIDFQNTYVFTLHFSSSTAPTNPYPNFFNVHFVNGYLNTTTNPYAYLLGVSKNCIFENMVQASDQTSFVHGAFNCIAINCSLTGKNTWSGVRRYGGCFTRYNSDETGSRATYHTICNSVAINVTTNSASYSQIYKIGPSTNRTLINNYATNGGSSVTDVNGLNITSTQYNNKTWWENTALYNFDSKYGAWTWNSNTNLPELSHNLETYDVMIYTYADLSNFAARVNSGETYLNAILMDDIDLTDIEFIPIGTSTYPYAGTFNGNGHTVSNFNNYFIYGSLCEIKNLKLTDVTITYSGSDSAIKYILHVNDGIIHDIGFENCSVNTTSSGQEKAANSSLIHSDSGTLTVYNVYGIGGTLSSYKSAQWLDTYASPICISQGSTPIFNIHDVYFKMTSISSRSASVYCGNQLGHMVYTANSSSSISRVVVLTPTVSYGGGSSTKNAYRISGAGTISNAYALSPYTQNNSSVEVTTTSTSTGGAPVSSATAATQPFWQSTVGFDFTNTWYWDPEDNLPKLKVFKNPVNIFLKKESSWVSGMPYIKVNGTWIPGEQVYIKVNGTWQLQSL